MNNTTLSDIRNTEEREGAKNMLNTLEQFRNYNSYDYIIDLYNYDDNAYICDIVTEESDSNINIYNDDLIEWVKHNYEYIEIANNEFGHVNDFFDQIRQAQYFYNQEQYNTYLKETILTFIYHELLNNNIDEINEDVYNDIESLEAWDFDTVEDVKNKVDELIENINDTME